MLKLQINRIQITNLVRVLCIVWCLTKFMLTTITDFDTAQVMDKNSSMDIVSVCKPHCNNTKFKHPWELRDVNEGVSMLGGLLTFEEKK